MIFILAMYINFLLPCIWVLDITDPRCSASVRKCLPCSYRRSNALKLSTLVGASLSEPHTSESNSVSCLLS